MPASWFLLWSCTLLKWALRYISEIFTFAWIKFSKFTSPFLWTIVFDKHHSVLIEENLSGGHLYHDLRGSVNRASGEVNAFLPHNLVDIPCWFLCHHSLCKNSYDHEILFPYAYAAFHLPLMLHLMLNLNLISLFRNQSEFLSTQEVWASPPSWCICDLIVSGSPESLLAIRRPNNGGGAPIPCAYFVSSSPFVLSDRKGFALLGVTTWREVIGVDRVENSPDHVYLVGAIRLESLRSTLTALCQNCGTCVESLMTT